MNPQPNPLRLFVKAVAFAAHQHRNQRRKDAEALPYINHPIALANVLANEGGITDVAVLCAAVLHDTIEDTEATSEELTAVFGSQITAIVLEVTDDKSLEKGIRKQRQIEQAPHLSKEAQLVKLADKICNLRDILVSPPSGWSRERQQEYFDWAAKVIAGVRGVHPELEAVFDGLLARHNQQDKAALQPLWRRQHPLPHTVQARFAGCLLGGAVGDALGAPVEFMKRTEILRRFGPEGITQYAPAYGGLGTITDDTQMTLFTAEGLIRAGMRGSEKSITSYTTMTAHAYLRWLQTQGERSLLGVDPTGWLFQQKELHSRRAPGNTCLAALRAMKSLGEPAQNNSKGCGGVMRVAPVGLFSWCLRQPESPQSAFRLGTALAALTHGHPTGSLTGGVLAVLILALVEGASLPQALTAAKTLLRSEPEHEETLRSIEMAEALATRGLPHEVAIAQLGQGWVAEEALAIALYCALVAKNFQQGIILAVNHDGDSDSTGSITGNLLGTLYGVEAIPSEWLEPLELREVITTLAEDLYAFKDWDMGGYRPNAEMNPRIGQRYPGS